MIVRCVQFPSEGGILPLRLLLLSSSLLKFDEVSYKICQGSTEIIVTEMQPLQFLPCALRKPLHKYCNVSTNIITGEVQDFQTAKIFQISNHFKTAISGKVPCSCQVIVIVVGQIEELKGCHVFQCIVEMPEQTASVKIEVL